MTHKVQRATHLSGSVTENVHLGRPCDSLVRFSYIAKADVVLNIFFLGCQTSGKLRLNNLITCLPCGNCTLRVQPGHTRPTTDCKAKAEAGH